MNEYRIEDDLCNFVKDFCDDLSTLQLLLFFSRHPNAHFNRSALMHALPVKQFDTGAALDRLIEKKIVVMGNENSLSLFSLTKDEAVRKLAIQMLNIDRSRWQVILENILDAHGIR